jgi:hypothetical protein
MCECDECGKCGNYAEGNYYKYVKVDSVNDPVN